ncbi:MAG: hypothetical protein WBO46_20520 [Caldilineaceae bacterium]
MPEPELIQRQRDTLAAFRQADRARRETEAAIHKQYEQIDAAATAAAALKTAQQKAENARKDALAAAESHRQTVHSSATISLETTRSQAQQQIDSIAAHLRNGQDAVQKAELSHLWPTAPAKIITVEPAQAKVELARCLQSAAQSGMEFTKAMDEWDAHQARISAAAEAVVKAADILKISHQNAENAQKEAISTAESQRQTIHNNATSALETTRRQVKQLIDFTAAHLRQEQNLVQKAGLNHRWPTAAAKPVTVELIQTETELARRIQLVTQVTAELNGAIGLWQAAQKAAQERAAQEAAQKAARERAAQEADRKAARERAAQKAARRRGILALAILLVLVIIFSIIIRRSQTNQIELRSHASVMVLVLQTDKLKTFNGIKFAHKPTDDLSDNSCWNDNTLLDHYLYQGSKDV